MALSVQRLDNLEVIQRRTFSYRFQHPLQEARFILRLKGVRFPVEGLYEVVLSADGEPIAQRKCRIVYRES